MRFLLTHIERLRAVVELAREMPPTVEDHGDGWFTCRECGAYSVHAEFEHDEHCTSQRLQAALRALDGGAE